jgi:hypothetical protein
MTEQRQTPEGFLHILRSIYNLPASVIVVRGEWKTGKTDFALFTAQVLRELGLITHIGSNIEVYKDIAFNEPDNVNVNYIDALNTLKVWASAVGKKLFIYDEVIESMPSRSSMSRLNVSWLKFLPQLSKLHTHLIVVTQERSMIDSIFKNRVFNRGEWEKTSLTTAIFRSRSLGIRGYILKTIPKTILVFNPDKIASFQLEQSSTVFETLPRTLQVAKLLSQGYRLGSVRSELQINDEQIHREIVKISRILITLSQDSSMGNTVSNFVRKLDE